MELLGGILSGLPATNSSNGISRNASLIRLAGAFTRDFSAISFTIRQIQCSSILFDLCQIAFQNSVSFRAGGELRP